jgi:hypothetical protein
LAQTQGTAMKKILASILLLFSAASSLRAAIYLQISFNMPGHRLYVWSGTRENAREENLITDENNGFTPGLKSKSTWQVVEVSLYK